MTPPAEPPQAVRDLAAERQAARERRDYARADALRDELRAAGWLVSDTPAGPELTEAPPYRPVDPAALPPRWEDPDQREVSVVVHVAGWPRDVARAVAALAAHCGGVDYEVVLVDDGAEEAAGRALEDLARADERVRVLHLEPARGFGTAMNPMSLFGAPQLSACTFRRFGGRPCTVYWKFSGNGFLFGPSSRSPRSLRSRMRASASTWRSPTSTSARRTQTSQSSTTPRGPIGTSRATCPDRTSSRRSATTRRSSSPR